jgi:DNA gyrase subunit A
MQNNDIYDELHRNFIEYAYAVNTDRAIPSALDGLKPVAKRILYSCDIEGRSFSKPHVKSARIVGDVMSKFHPHGDSSIYGAMARLSQDWVMRYPLIDWHGNNGNIVGDGPAAARYTEARLARIAEKGLLKGLDKDIVDFIPNYDETMEEPVVLHSIFPNLLCNPNSGIGVAMACNWAPHNLKEVAGAIAQYMNGEEPTLPGPDFPTGGIVINKDDIPDIMRTGHGSVRIRGKYRTEKNNIVFYEIPYGITIESLLEQIGDAAEEINGIDDVRDETNKKGIRLVIELERGANVNYIVNQLFAKTDLQTTFSYNQVALVGKTPTELNLKDCCKIYVDHNLSCLRRELEFDIRKDKARVEIIEGLLKAIEDIDNIIALIKKSDNSAAAKDALIAKYKFTENQAKAILAMRLSSLAKLEGIELNQERDELLDRINSNNLILSSDEKQKYIILSRLNQIVNEFGDDRKTELAQITIAKEDKEIAAVEPEKVAVIMTESGLIKRVPVTAFKTQRRGGKGVKTNDDIVNSVIRTNTVDSLMVFTDKGNMYRLLVDKIPETNNTTKGVPITTLLSLAPNEKPAVIYSIYKDTDAKFVLFVTKNGVVKKTPIDEYIKTKKKTGISSISLREGDSLASIGLIKDEPIMLITKKGMCIKFSSLDIAPTSRSTQGVKGITLNDGDEVVAALVVRDENDSLGIFAVNGNSKRVAASEFITQKRGGKGVICYKGDSEVADAALLNDEDTILIVGLSKSICISAKDISTLGRNAAGVIAIKDRIQSVSKV